MSQKSSVQFIPSNVPRLLTADRWTRELEWGYRIEINSGDILKIADVVHDFYRATDEPEQRYVERQLFEAALDRLAREIAAVRKSDLSAALNFIEAALEESRTRP